MVDEIFFGAVGTDVTLQREFTGDDFLDGDFLVPAVAAIALVSTRLGDLFRAAQRTPAFND